MTTATWYQLGANYFPNSFLGGRVSCLRSGVLALGQEGMSSVRGFVTAQLPSEHVQDKLPVTLTGVVIAQL